MFTAKPCRIKQSDTDIVSSPRSSDSVSMQTNEHESADTATSLDTDIAAMIEEMQEIFTDGVTNLDIVTEDLLVDVNYDKSPTPVPIAAMHTLQISRSHEKPAESETEAAPNREKKLSSLMAQINGANDVSDLSPIIARLHALDAIKQLLLRRLTELPFYDERHERNCHSHSVDKLLVYHDASRSASRFLSDSNGKLQIRFRGDMDTETDTDGLVILEDSNSEHKHVQQAAESEDVDASSYYRYLSEPAMAMTKTQSYSINNLYLLCTPIEQLFSAHLLCTVIVYLSKSSMYRKLPILNRYFNHLMRNNAVLYQQYEVEIPYTIYTRKTCIKLYGKILHETNTIKIYNKLQVIKDTHVALNEYDGGPANNIHFLSVHDVDDTRTISSADQRPMHEDDASSALHVSAYDTYSADLEFEINDIQDLHDNIPFIWSSIPKWKFILSHPRCADHYRCNNELLTSILEKAAPSIRAIGIEKASWNMRISQNDIIHFSTFENLLYLNATTDFFLSFLEYSDESRYILSNLMCVDLIHVEHSMVNIINDNLPRLLVLRLQFLDNDKSDHHLEDGQLAQHHVLKLPKTLEFLQINGFDFNCSTYTLDFTQCPNLICLVFKESTLLRQEQFDDVICRTIQERIMWNAKTLIQCVVIDEVDTEYNSCWYRYFSSISNENKYMSFNAGNLPKIQYLRYLNAENVSVVRSKAKQRVQSEIHHSTHLEEPAARSSRPITASPMLKYNNSLSIHGSDHDDVDDDDGKEEHEIELIPHFVDEALCYNPLQDMSFVNINEIGKRAHKLFSVLSDDRNSGLLYRLLIGNKYRKHTEIVSDRLNIYDELFAMHTIKWVKALGYKKPYLPFVNFSIPNRYSQSSNLQL